MHWPKFPFFDRLSGGKSPENGSLLSDRLRFVLIDFRKIAQPRSAKKIYVYSILIGLLSGLMALFFAWSLAWAEHLTFIVWAGKDLGHAAGEFRFGEAADLVLRPWVLFVLPIGGALISGLLVQFLDPTTAGAGTNAVIHAYHHKEAIIRKRNPVVKYLASIATLASGGSAGKEGPTAQIGSALGSLFGRMLGLGPKARRTLYLAGLAGALGAVFRAPLGAAITAVEVLYKEDFESESLIPCVLSSISGYFVYSSVRGFHTVFHSPTLLFNNWKELGIYILLGLSCFLFGWLFVVVHNSVEAFFRRMKIPIFLKVMIGGVLVAVIGSFSHEILGGGFGYLQKLVDGQPMPLTSPMSKLLLGGNAGTAPGHLMLALFFLAVVLLKILATSFTVGSGGSGGVFGPSLFIGGFLGAAVGKLAQLLFPEITHSYIPYMVVGMAAFFAAVANAPIASIIMVCELTGSYNLLAPLMAVAAIALIFSHKFGIYSEQKLNKFHSPAHEWDMTFDVLESIPVSTAATEPIEGQVTSARRPVSELLRISSREHSTDFLVHDGEGKYAGVVSTRSFEGENEREIAGSDLRVADVMSAKMPALKNEDPLSEALDLLMNYDFDKVAVTDEQGILRGVVSFRSILQAYRRKVKKIAVTGDTDDKSRRAN